METNVTPSGEGQRTRKIKTSPNIWKKNINKCLKYKPKDMPEYPTCGHNKGSFECTLLSMNDIKTFHGQYYRKPDRQYQNDFILKHTQTSKVKRRRPDQKKTPERETKKYKAQLRTTKYFVRNEQKYMVPVCIKTFCGILHISRFRINRITKQFFEEGATSDKRGGFRMADQFIGRKVSVMNFIEKLNCVESHYCRSSTSNRKYLPSELNIKKLWKLHSSDPETIPVKESYFRAIFNCNYNLGFGSPRTDVCSTCLSLDERLKRETDEMKKSRLMIELRVHKLRAKSFYNKLKEVDDGLLTLSFDCQKNLPIPKLPDQSTYYSRQVYVQNLTVVQGYSKSKLNRTTVTAYCWTENKYERDSNMIASCVYDALNSIDMTPYKTIRLISDGCGGQNKNSIFIAMCTFWLKAIAPKHIEEIEVVYPVTGHSFLPSDRVFGYIEHKLKKKEVIATYEEVIEIISNHALVKHVGKDCEVADFRTAAKTYMNETKNFHFKISKCKRIMIKRSIKYPEKVVVRGEEFYQIDNGKYKSLMKPDKTPMDLNPDIIEEKNCLSREKKKDVAQLLLKHYGDDWRNFEELKFYKDIIDHTPVIEAQGPSEDIGSTQLSPSEDIASAQQCPTEENCTSACVPDESTQLHI